MPCYSYVVVLPRIHRGDHDKSEPLHTDASDPWPHVLASGGYDLLKGLPEE